MAVMAHSDRIHVLLFMGGAMGAWKSTVLKEVLKDVGNTQAMHTQPTNLAFPVPEARIEDAHWSLRNIVRKGDLKNRSATKKSKDGKRNGISNSPEETTSKILESPDSHLFDIVSFQKDNFVQGLSSPGDKVYDTILSVSKWIHLNWGDEGVITLFSKVWRLLQPGGVFILEPQPWKSYISNRQVSQVASTYFKNFEIFPNQFQEILLDKVARGILCKHYQDALAIGIVQENPQLFVSLAWNVKRPEIKLCIDELAGLST